jgi:nitroreductase
MALLRNLSDRAKPLFVAEVQERGLERAGHSFEAFSHPEFNIFYDASTLIIICGRTTSSTFEADCWLSAENLMLAACAMGLGSCVIGSALSALYTQETKTLLNIPENFKAVAPIVVGYPDDDIAPVIRKNPVILANIPALQSG